MPPTISKQAEILLRYVKGLRPTDITEELVEKVVGWVRDLPPGGRPPDLVQVLSSKLGLSEIDVAKHLEKSIAKVDFDLLVPKSGWLHDYIEYTRNTEPPTVFHFFAGMVAIGASLARNIFFDMGAYQIFPNLCIVVVAPSGRCRKTSACNVAVGLYRSVGGNILADKVTPEALVSAFQDQTNATGLIYAPELAVFLGKQKYQEGMVPLLTALFDCPKEWASLTIMRGESHLRNVAISFLVCSTMDWIQSAIPREAFGGGFMSRLLFVVQNETPRSFPHPPPLDTAMQHKLKAALFAFTKLKGQFKVTDEANDWYIAWYNKKATWLAADRQFAGYVERKPDHLHRLAMVLAVAEFNPEVHTDFVLTRERFEQALTVLDWVEGHLPAAFSEMSQTPEGEENSRLLKQLKQHGGVLPHSDWLRLNNNRLNKDRFKQVVGTLREAKLVDYDAVKKAYYLTPEGWSR